MITHLKIYVRDELFKGEEPPPSNNRRFYPKRKSVINHMYLATIKLRYDKIDQLNVEQLVTKWRDERPNDKFFFHPYACVKTEDALQKAVDVANDSSCNMDSDDGEVRVTITTSNQRLLFIHQTKEQADPLLKYGNEIALLDATYKTTRYSLPLFFVVVRTNTDYQIVASFVHRMRRQRLLLSHYRY